MKKDKHPARKGKIKKSLYKLLTLFIIIVLICVGCGIFYAKDLTYGYKYYETNTLQPIAVTQQENFFYNTVETFLAELEEKGYYIVSFEVNLDTICKHTVIKKSEINDDYFKNQIISSLNIDIFTTKLTIKDDNTIYYFTTEDKCKEFINELNKYITQDYNIESSIEDYSIITSQNVLDTKLNNVIEQKKQKDAEEAAKKKAAAKKKQVTSRGGTTIRKSNYSNGVPMATYTYISSYYGMRNGRMHTGVDFAASQGTTIYAWKSGTIVTASWNGSYGNFIEIQHEDGTISRYAHLSKYAVSKGDTVVKGQTIGYVGSTGNSTGPHLHFEIKINGNFVNPLDYI